MHGAGISRIIDLKFKETGRDEDRALACWAMIGGCCMLEFPSRCIPWNVGILYPRKLTLKYLSTLSCFNNGHSRVCIPGY